MVTLLRLRMAERNLVREYRRQGKKEYWHQREKARRRQFWATAFKYRIRFGARSTVESIGILWDAFTTVLRWFVIGALSISAVVAFESVIARYLLPSIVLNGKIDHPLTGFVPIAVQVSASLLGFYLASVGIVLGTSYHDVSVDVRSLVLSNVRTKWQLKTIGAAIGIGLALLLLHPLVAITFGYMTVSIYVVLVAFSGWAFIQLAFGAFHLFNPTELAKEPLRELYRVVTQLDSRHLLHDDTTLAATARRANGDLHVLAELVNLIGRRTLVDQGALARTVQHLLRLIELFAEKKHLLVPTSGWFFTEHVYPKWVESDPSMMLIALQTSTHLDPKQEPVVDWFERQSAELAAAALRACVDANDQDSALIITRSATLTAARLAQQFRIDDAIMIAEVVRDACWTGQSDNEAARTVAAEPPWLLTNILLGWEHALNSWPKEVEIAVEKSDRHLHKAPVVSTRGPKRVWEAAQRLHNEIKAELAIEGHRLTPDWYLKSALADECIQAISENVDQLPDLLKSFTNPTYRPQSSKVEVAIALQSLQTVQKAKLLAETIPNAVVSLEQLTLGQDKQSHEGLLDSVRTIETPLLVRIANAITELCPQRSSSEPDMFGEALFTLKYHLEQEIAIGKTNDLQDRFEQAILATFKMHRHIMSNYQSSIYRVNVSVFDSIIDLLELSGLSLVYEVLRDDESSNRVCQAWESWLEKDGRTMAPAILSVLDIADGVLSSSHISILRHQWNLRLSDKIREAGYARPEYFPGNAPLPWNAPKLIKMLDLTSLFSDSKIYPRTIFAAEIIAQFAEDSEEQLRIRPGLIHYYKEKDNFDKDDMEGC